MGHVLRKQVRTSFSYPLVTATAYSSEAVCALSGI